jgi:hypothetical protein
MDIYIIESRPVRTLTPVGYYRKLCDVYVTELGQKYNHGHYFSYMHHACDTIAREMYSHITGRKLNVTNLIISEADADKVFEYFKIFANVWVYQVTGGADRKASEKERQIKRITDVLHSANTEQLERLDAFIRTYVQ